MSTHSDTSIHLVWPVQGKSSIITPAWEQKLYNYAAGILKNKNQKVLAINGASDHIHILINMHPTCCLSDLVREVKKSTNAYINANHFTPSRFYWQEGFGAFSHSPSEISAVKKYIRQQKQYHRHTSFRDEYIAMLKEHQICYNEQYLFDWIE